MRATGPPPQFGQPNFGAVRAALPLPLPAPPREGNGAQGPGPGPAGLAAHDRANGGAPAGAAQQAGVDPNQGTPLPSFRAVSPHAEQWICMLTENTSYARWEHFRWLVDGEHFAHGAAVPGGMRPAAPMQPPAAPQPPQQPPPLQPQPAVMGYPQQQAAAAQQQQQQAQAQAQQQQAAAQAAAAAQAQAVRQAQVQQMNPVPQPQHAHAAANPHGRREVTNDYAALFVALIGALYLLHNVLLPFLSSA
jgi:hypothetical protein